MTLQDAIRDKARKVSLTLRDWVAIVGLLYAPLGWAANKAVEINDRVVQVHAVVMKFDSQFVRFEKRLAVLESAAKKPLPE